MRVLVVDDEVALLQLIQRYLVRLGYEVEIHSRACDALNAFESNPAAFAVVLTDLNMPEISGEELLDRLLQLNPDVRIVICSGYPFPVSTLPEHIQPRVRFLQKPFLPHMLTTVIEDLLKPQT